MKRRKSHNQGVDCFRFLLHTMPHLAPRGTGVRREKWIKPQQGREGDANLNIMTSQGVNTWFILAC